MKPLAPTEAVTRILRNLSAQSLVDAENTFRSDELKGGWKRIGTRRFRFAYELFDHATGEVTRVYDVELCWGSYTYEIPVTHDLAIALSKNFCTVASRTAGRGRRADFAVREGGR